MLQMLGHVKRRTEHLIGALDQGRGQTDGAADVAALCLSWRRSVGARYGARLIYVGSVHVRYETVRIGSRHTGGKGRAPTTRPPPLSP